MKADTTIDIDEDMQIELFLPNKGKHRSRNNKDVLRNTFNESSAKYSFYFLQNRQQHALVSVFCSKIEKQQSTE